jgi:hypothetical protein
MPETTGMNTLRKSVGNTRMDQVIREQQENGRINAGKNGRNHIASMTEGRIVLIFRDNLPKSRSNPGRSGIVKPFSQPGYLVGS